MAGLLESAQPVDFAEQLQHYMRRIRASANGMATEIGMSREAVNNWRHGYSMPSARHRHKVLEGARYLRLTEKETNDLLLAAGFDPEYVHSAGKQASSYIHRVFESLASLAPYSIKMLLSQAGWAQPPYRDALLEQASQLYGSDNVLHIQPPFSMDTTTEEYFQQIALQCRLDGVTNDFSFESGLEGRLRCGDRIFCLVSRFEQGDAVRREQLAGILRSVSETHAGRLHLLLCGGPALADLKFQSGDLSLLNIADLEVWPDPGLEEINLLAAEMGLTEISQDDGQWLIAVTGGHPGLLQQAIRLLSSGVSRADIAADLENNERVWQAFSTIAADRTLKEQLRGAVDDEDLGPARPYLVDPLKKALFWQNLITSRPGAAGRRLVWRCDAVQGAGRAVCGG